MLINTVNIGIRGREIASVFPQVVFKDRLLPISFLSVGTEYTSNEIAIPIGLDSFKHNIMRGVWPDIGSDVVSVIVEISLDGGTTWPIVRSFTSTGGNLSTRGGSSSPYSGLGFKLPDTGNPNRKFRVKRNVFTNLTTFDEVELD